MIEAARGFPKIRCTLEGVYKCLQGYLRIYKVYGSGFPKIRGTILAVVITRIIAFGRLGWGASRSFGKLPALEKKERRALRQRCSVA